MNLIVSRETLLTFGDKTYRCAVGRNGFSEHKREGDLCTPVGIFPLRTVYYRTDKLPPMQTRLTHAEITPDLGWCDAPGDPAYNQIVKLPYAASHETLWREDDVYDVVVPLGYNDDPVLPGLGSAIFLHVARADYSPTEGCVALALPDLLEILYNVTPDSQIEIRPDPSRQFLLAD